MNDLKNKQETVKFLKNLASARNPVEVHREEGIMYGLLQDVSETNMHIKVIENNSIIKLKKNDFFMIQFIFNGERYQLITRPLRFIHSSNSFETEIPYFVENLNIRTYPRFDFDFTYKAYFSYKGFLAFGFVKNISEGGFLLNSEQIMDKSEEYLFGFVIPTGYGDFKELFFKAKVAHASKKQGGVTHQVGMQFIGLRKDMKQSIKTLVMALNVWKNLGEKSPESIQNITHPNQKTMLEFSETLARKFSENISKKQRETTKNPHSKSLKIRQPAVKILENRKKKILCIVANSEERNTIKELISEHYELEFIINPLGTVNKMIDCKPDMVISEINLDDVDFFTIRKAAKKTPTIADIPFVVYTVNNDKTAIVNALRNGNVSEYIIKPILKGDFVSRLNNVLKIS